MVAGTVLADPAASLSAAGTEVSGTADIGSAEGETCPAVLEVCLHVIIFASQHHSTWLVSLIVP